MNITTRAQDFEMTSAIDNFVREQLADALERMESEIIAVDVYMKDTNGPKGGNDKMTRIRVRLRNRHIVTTETTHDNLYASVKTGVRRTKRAASRQLRKARSIERQPLRNALTQSTSLRVPWI
jgi:ribosomal subunit interface protein